MLGANSPLAALAVIIVALATAFVIGKIFGAPEGHARFATIDGLRGYLAILVFISHACIWFFFLRTGKWILPTSHLYAHLGKIGVYMFFMITGFLFFTKIIDGRTKPVDWTRLYVSRVLRLTPLYLFVMVLVFLIIAIKSNFTLNESVSILLLQMSRWLGFTVFGMPDINHVSGTAEIIASVAWSLPYEWFFYLSLPLISLLVGVVPPTRFLLLGGVSLIAFILWRPESGAYIAFASGMFAAILVRIPAVCNVARSHWMSAAIIAGLAISIALFPLERTPMSFVILSLSFLFIACGNSLFGLLTNRLSFVLGEISYGIYLLHGITLYVIFEGVLGLSRSAKLSPLLHWIVILIDTPVLIALSFAVYRLVERRPMQSVTAVCEWWRSLRPIRQRAVKVGP